MKNKLDENKHLILKWDDINELDEEQKKQLSKIITNVRFNRLKRGKKELNDYLALNLDNEIDIGYLIEKLMGKEHQWRFKNHTGYNLTVRHIALDIVNGIELERQRNQH